MKKFLIIAKREYIKIIRRPAFWLSTLFFPIFIIIVSLISGVSANKAEESFKNGLSNSKEIAIIDYSNYIDKTNIVAPFKIVNDESQALKDLQNGDIDAVFIYRNDFTKTKNIEIYQQDKGLFLQGRYNEAAASLIKSNIINEIKDPKKIETFYSTFNYKTKSYKDGKEVTVGFESLIVPGIFVVIYFVLVTFATSYLLLSVAEEKENRVMEIMLSSVTPKELIGGKIIGLIGIILTQVILLILLSIAGIAFVIFLLSSQAGSSAILPSINLATLNINPLQILLDIIYIFLGFIVMACTMVGVGSAMPTYRDSQSFASVFIILSIFPMYFVSLIIAEPSGTIAQIFSYFPYSAGLILLFRNALGVLSPLEIILSLVLLIVYSYLIFVIAFKLFEFGSLEYTKKISFKDFFLNIIKRN